MLKIERLLAMVVLLLAKEQVTAKEMAERFAVSKRTIYRDMVTIEAAGFPIIANYGSEGGYSLMAGFKLHSYTFSAEEKRWLQKALALQGDLLDETSISRSISDKLSLLSGSGEEEPLRMTLAEGTIHNPKIEAVTKDKIQQLTAALTNHQKVAIVYVSNKGSQTKRVVMPLQLKLENGSWYLAAFCELRQEQRLFKLTRILSFELLASQFKWQTTVNGRQAPSQEVVEPQLVNCQFNQTEYGKLLDFFVVEQLLLIQPDLIEVSFEQMPNQNLIPFLLMFGHKVKVISPPSLVFQHQQAIDQLTKIYDRDES